MKLDDHPTVKRYRERAASSSGTSRDPVDAALLKKMCREAGADDAGFAGQWMLRIVAPDVVPYEGVLELEQRGDAWVAHVENGPTPVIIDGNRIELTLDTPFIMDGEVFPPARSGPMILSAREEIAFISL